jgi:hypothetical protein
MPMVLRTVIGRRKNIGLQRVLEGPRRHGARAVTSGWPGRDGGLAFHAAVTMYRARLLASAQVARHPVSSENERVSVRSAVEAQKRFQS